MSNKKFTVLGGDKRSIELINLLLESKNPVNVFGFDKVNKNLRIKQSESLEDAIKGSDIIIGPLPFSILEEQINLTSLLELMSKDQLLLGGKIDKDFSDKCISNNINIIDYFDREEMQILNAIPTAEGAISIAMEKLQVTISSSNALVLGYGRIGKVLSKMLNGIGANTYVAARKKADLAWINTNGYKAIDLYKLNQSLSNINIIFNTIPSLILKEKELCNLNKDTLIIDLASKPGGVDFIKAKEMNLNVNWALGLPGKVAPITAAKIIKDTIYNIIEERKML
ncbi:MAG: dipicolinate synthase subunit DpsA [Senegalia sp. (in: firmicutes)]|uniref:dipicolinate synthase subunit DpsA n=1 Tax=Senegalia sp. (in: firmicutes) TaxID=1924098 RepID=UPI003F98B69B